LIAYQMNFWSGWLDGPPRPSPAPTTTS